MNLIHIDYFNKVCENGSITRASELCFVSQPSITAAISNLEKELGYRLFYRSNNRLTLTDEGKEFYKYSSCFMDSYNEFYKKACDISENRKTTLRVGIPSVFGSFITVPLYNGFHKYRPNIILNTLDCGTNEGIEMMSNDKLDVLFGILEDTQQKNNIYEFTSIMPTELSLAVNINNPLSSESVITEDILSNIPIALFPEGTFSFKFICKTFSSSQLNIIMQTSQVSTIAQAIEADILSAVVYTNLFKNSPKIKYIPFEKKFNTSLNIIWPKHIYTQKAVSVFVNYVTKNLPALINNS